MTDVIRYKTAGFTAEDVLDFEPGQSSCGEIEDGVAFAHGWRNGFGVLAFADLQDAYFRAAKERHMSVEHVGRAYLDHPVGVSAAPSIPGDDAQFERDIKEGW